MLYQKNDEIYRKLKENEKGWLVINCQKKAMPFWCPSDGFKSAQVQDTRILLGVESKPSDGLAEARKRYSVIAPILPCVDMDKIRTEMIRRQAEDNGVSISTVRRWLCTYLVYQDLESLASHQNRKIKNLTPDEKKMRWGLNKFYYTQHKNSLFEAYTMLIKEKYTDPEGKVLSKHPTIHQFRYFYRKTKSAKKLAIKRDGIKDYEKNQRPLLGGGVQVFAPIVGYGMCDSTVCDIYLVDDEGNICGRPLLVLCTDANTGLVMGYFLGWEGGLYSLNELMLNVIADKKPILDSFGIDGHWDINQLPGYIIADRGSEYISDTFGQITELGCQITSLPSFRAELKSIVERAFGLIQETFKPHLKGKGVIEEDFQERGAHDYRKDACLTIRDFEKVILLTILYHNNARILRDYPYSEEMLADEVPPHSADIFMWMCRKGYCNLIPVSAEQLTYTLLPRIEGEFTREGLKANKLRYRNDAYEEQFLSGGKAKVSYNPDDCSKVWIWNGSEYVEFQLIETRFSGKPLSIVEDMKAKQRELVRREEEKRLQAKVDLSFSFDAIKETTAVDGVPSIKGIRDARKREQLKQHKDRIRGIHHV